MLPVGQSKNDVWPDEGWYWPGKQRLASVAPEVET
jgi:hypothetical protein